MGGEYISIKSRTGGEFKGYLAVPRAGSGPGLVVIQEVFGVNSHIRSVVDQYAEQGYVALAPDLFWRLKPGFEVGYGPSDLEIALGYYERFDQADGIADIADAIAALRDLKALTGKIAVIGFCLGGTMAFRTAAHYDIDAAVCYYGGGIAQHLAEAEKIRCPMLLHFGELDEDIPLDSVRKIENALGSHAHVSVHVYRNAHHGFNCNERASYDKESATIAFLRTLDFLRTFIGPAESNSK